jgi:hypothetical protein
MMTWVILVVLIVVLVIGYNSRRRAAELRVDQVRKQAQAASYAEEALDRPADIAVELLTQHLPTLVEKSAPHIKRDDYGVMNLAPEFDPLSSAVQVRSGLSPGGSRIRTVGPRLR